MTLVVGVALRRGDRVLVARRADRGRWEFPGGKVEPGESPDDAAVREIREELGCRIEVTGWLATEVEIRPGMTLRVALARLADGEPIPTHHQHDAIRWTTPASLPALDWLDADLPFVAELTRGLSA